MLYPPSLMLQEAPCAQGAGAGLGEPLSAPSVPGATPEPHADHSFSHLCLTSFLVAGVLCGLESLSACPRLSHTKEISNKLEEWNWAALRWSFFHSAQWIQEWWLQRPLLSGHRAGEGLLNGLITDHKEPTLCCSAGSQVSRCERREAAQTRGFSAQQGGRPLCPSAPNQEPSSLPSAV